VKTGAKKKKMHLILCVSYDKEKKNRGIFNSKKTKAGILLAASVSVSIMRDIYIRLAYIYIQIDTDGQREVGLRAKKESLKSSYSGLFSHISSRVVLYLT